MNTKIHTTKKEPTAAGAAAAAAAAVRRRIPLSVLPCPVRIKVVLIDNFTRRLFRLNVQKTYRTSMVDAATAVAYSRDGLDSPWGAP